MATLSSRQVDELLEHILLLAQGHKPLAIVIVDSSGTEQLWHRIGADADCSDAALDKALAALRYGHDTVALHKGTPDDPQIIETLPFPGGVLLRDRQGTIVGAVGVCSGN